MGWQDAPVVGSTAQPAWASAPMVAAAQKPLANGHGPVGRRPATWNEFNPVEAVAEGGAQAVSGAGASILGGLGYLGTAGLRAIGGTDAQPSKVMGGIQDSLTYKPTSRSSQLVERGAKALLKPAVAKAAELGDEAATSVGTVSPVAETMMREAPAAFGAAASVLPVMSAARPLAEGAASIRSSMKAAPERTAEDVVSRLDTKQSMGSAAAAPSLLNVSPELRQAITKSAQKTGGAINPEVLSRHIEADTLPVPVRLTEGQALQDPMLISQERNTRGQSQVMVEHLNDQNRRLAQNVQHIRDEVGPEVFSTNPVEHGDTLIGAYRAKDAVAQKQIAADYKALKDANGGQFPVDASALVQNASTALHQQLLFDHAPKAVMSTLTRLAERGNMTFENFESLRTNLARIQRSATADGNEKAAAGVIRQAMEDLPLQPQAAAVKPLADKARASARAHHQAMEADPAYMAAVDESVPPDRFVDRYVINAPRDNVARMRETLADDDRAIQTMGVAALDYLRNQARLSPHYEGNFAAATFNRGLQSLSPKLQYLVSPETAEQLEKLGSVARYTVAQPAGSFVNNSNTAVALAADYGGKAAEHVVNTASGGLPVGTIGRSILGGMTRNRAARRSTAPGAGLSNLGDIGRRQ